MFQHQSTARSRGHHQQQSFCASALVVFIVFVLLFWVGLIYFLVRTNSVGHHTPPTITPADPNIWNLPKHNGAGALLSAPLNKPGASTEERLEEAAKRLSVLRDLVLAAKNHVQSINKAQKQPSGSASPNNPNEETIFINIASYRDEECPHTLRDLFKKATAPWRIFVGVVQQNEEKDPWCWPEEWNNCSKDVFCPSDQVRIRNVNAKDARGPVLGRYYADTMYRGEKFYFMMDSHNRFLQGWDEILIRDLKATPTYPYSVLSHYPEGYDPKSPNGVPTNSSNIVFNCQGSFLPEGFIRHGSLVVPRSKKPRLEPFSAAGMIFGLGKMFKEVPFDPHMPYLFDGEEILYSVRMWTHGYDMYSPTCSVIFHYYYRPSSKKVWEHQSWYPNQLKSIQRVQYILGVTHANTTIPVIPPNTTEKHIIVEIDKYGLGKARPLQKYWETFNINPINRTMPSTWCDKAFKEYL
eukprot:PhF_6_TR617/c0_g1_i2/m.806